MRILREGTASSRSPSAFVRARSVVSTPPAATSGRGAAASAPPSARWTTIADLDSELIAVEGRSRSHVATGTPKNSSMNASSPDSTTATLSTTQRNTRPPLDGVARAGGARRGAEHARFARRAAPADAAESRSRAARTADQVVGGSPTGSGVDSRREIRGALAWSSACAWRRAASLMQVSIAVAGRLASSCSTTFLASAVAGRIKAVAGGVPRLLIVCGRCYGCHCKLLMLSCSQDSTVVQVRRRF